MSSYQPYPAYKDSGVEWLGEVPEHWKIRRLGQYFNERREKVSDKDFAALSVTKNGIVPQLENAAKTDAGDNRKKVCINDYVINSRSDRKGSSGLSELEGSVSLIATVLEPRGIVPKFVHHLFRSYPFQEEFYRFGKGIVADLWSTNYSEMKNINIPIPKPEEQNTIANFLDRETTKIDTLIEKQQELIKLLKEKRQAVISHAVITREDDETSKLSHYIDLLSGFAFSSSGFSQNDSDIKLLRGINVGVDHIRWNDIVYWSQDETKDLKEYYLEYGDIVFGMDRPWISSGTRVAKVTELDLPCLLVQRVTRLKVINGLFSEYLFLILSSNEFKSFIEADLTGVSVPHISPDQIKSFRFHLLDNERQEKVIQKVTYSLSKIDTLIEKSNQAITLLKERRTALISAAVTGKIDVRGEVA